MKKITVLVATILVVLVAMSTQGLSTEDGVDACYKKMNGQLRISDGCHPQSHLFHWFQEKSLMPLLRGWRGLELA